MLSIDLCPFLFLLLFAAIASSTATKRQALSLSSSPTPRLLLIAGCTGTGKTTLAMSAALELGMVKCISTDTIRVIMRAEHHDASLHPALHRSSYSGQGEVVTQWKECCEALDVGVQAVLQDSSDRRYSMVLEGVHLVPTNDLLNQWRSQGGDAVGCLLTIPDEDFHQNLIVKRGKVMTKRAEEQLRSFHRIRRIQDEMIKLAHENKWLIIEQTREDVDPLQLISSAFF